MEEWHNIRRNVKKKMDQPLRWYLQWQEIYILEFVVICSKPLMYNECVFSSVWKMLYKPNISPCDKQTRHLDFGKRADNAGRILPSTHPKGELAVKQIVAFTKKRLNCSNLSTIFLLISLLLLTSSHSLLPKASANIEEWKGKSFKQGEAKSLKEQGNMIVLSVQVHRWLKLV